MGANRDGSKCKVCHVGVGMRGRGSETRGGALEPNWAWSSDEEGMEAEPGECAQALKTKGMKFSENRALGLVRGVGVRDGSGEVGSGQTFVGLMH